MNPALLDLEAYRVRRELALFRAARRDGYNVWSWREKEALHRLPPWLVDGALVYGRFGGVSEVEWLGWDGPAYAAYADSQGRLVRRAVYRQKCEVARYPRRAALPDDLRRWGSVAAGLVMTVLGLPAIPAGLGTTDNYLAGTNDNYLTSSSSTWSIARAGSGVTLGTVSDTTIRCGAKYSVDTYYIYRSMEPFDCSSLPDDCTISAASISLTVSSLGGLGTTVHAVAYTGSNPMGTGNWASFGSTSWGSVSCNSTGTKTIPLDSNGQANISKAGVSLFGLRGSNDYNNSAPSDDRSFFYYSGDNASSKPSLSVTYSVLTAVGRDFESRFHVRNLAGRDFESRFNVRDVDPVGRDFESRFQVRNLAGRDFESRFQVRNLAGRDFESRFQVWPCLYFTDDPTWEPDLGAKVNRVWCLVEDSSPAILVSAEVPGLPEADRIEVFRRLPAGTSSAEASSIAAQILALYTDRPPRVEGETKLCAQIDFDRRVRAEWYQPRWDPVTKAYVRELKEAEPGLIVKKIEHFIDVGKFRTRVYLGDYLKPAEDLVTELIGRLSRKQ